ncbi:hypothetical protein TNCV_4521421 [Trichonephila clavipes]|nr:hypothetical protein TNCV_4521421 [Trichonephila clavipes]
MYESSVSVIVVTRVWAPVAWARTIDTADTTVATPLHLDIPTSECEFYDDVAYHYHNDVTSYLNVEVPVRIGRGAIKWSSRSPPVFNVRGL